MVLCAVIFVMASLFAASGAAAQGEEGGPASVNPHDFSRKEMCAICHIAESLKGPGAPKLSKDPVTTCAKCHMGNVGNHPVQRHPMGKRPNINLPESLPLSPEGLIVCYTCHNQHGKSGNVKMLRVPLSRLCSSCHVGY